MEAILGVFLDDPASSRYGLELSAMTGVKQFGLYPVLARLEATGWLTSDWEPSDPDREDAPRRRCCRITSFGMENTVRVVHIGSHKSTWREYFSPAPGWAR
jgi:PadR family transcriptional regulator PadR